MVKKGHLTFQKGHLIFGGRCVRTPRTPPPPPRYATVMYLSVVVLHTTNKQKSGMGFFKFHENVALFKTIDEFRRKEGADTFEITKIIRVCKSHF